MMNHTFTDSRGLLLIKFNFNSSMNKLLHSLKAWDEIIYTSQASTVQSLKLENGYVI